MLGRIKRFLELRKFSRKWRKNNKENSTNVERLFNMNLVSVGKCTYGNLYVLTFDDRTKLTIGSYCSIAPGVKFILSADHYLHNISTYPFKSKILSKGENEAIMSGVHIGQGSVIAAGAVVTADVLPYTIVGGIPAKVIKYRFSPEVIELLLKLDYSKLMDAMIRERIDDLYTSLEDKSPDEVKKLLEWFPKKQHL